MKKIFAISLALVYLLVSSGILLEIHHCMGRIANTGLTILANTANDECGKCGMKKTTSGKHCCKDEYKQVKISIDQKPASAVYSLDTPFIVDLPVVWPKVDYALFVPAIFAAYQSNAPPPLLLNRQSLFCVFRI